MNMFEKAVKMNWTFETKFGNINVLDLWELPLTSAKNMNLNDVARTLHNKIKAEDEESFVATTTNTTKKLLEDKLDLVKKIIADKLEAAEARKEYIARKQRKEKLQNILDRKREEALEAADIADIEAELATL